MTKVCSKCGKELPATTEYFGKVKANKDGLNGRCKDCIKKYEKQYREENKEHYKQYREKNKEYYKQYRKENKKEIKECQKEWYEKNKEEIKEYQKQWYKHYYKENKEHYKQYRKENKGHYKQYREENKKETKEYNKQYRQGNKEYYKQYRKENIDRFRQYSQKRRASKKRLPHTLTLDQWEKIKDDFNNRCAYCGMTEEEHIKRFGQVLHQEHFIPLSKDGEYTHNNIIPACKSCNYSKHNTDFFEWYPTYEHYNEEREQFILEYLGYIKDTQQLALDTEVI